MWVAHGVETLPRYLHFNVWCCQGKVWSTLSPFCTTALMLAPRRLFLRNRSLLWSMRMPHDWGRGAFAGCLHWSFRDERCAAMWLSRHEQHVCFHCPLNAYREGGLLDLHDFSYQFFCHSFFTVSLQYTR